MAVNERTAEKDSGTERPVQNGDRVLQAARPSYTQHVEPPEQGGEPYYRCNGCAREILASIGRENLVHADSCRVGNVDERSETTLQRHEPADFGGGESTGVQDL